MTRTLALEFLLFGTAVAAFGTASLPTADEIVARHVEARGGGRAYASTGETEKARKEFERALMLDPKNERARKALAALR